MKLRLLLFIVILLVSISIYSQESCGTSSPTTYQKFSKDVSKQLSPEDIFCINISFHVVRETDGSGGFPTSNISNIIQVLNEDYNQYGIFFNEAGNDFISNDEFHDLVYEEEDRSMLDALFNENNDPNAIDFYLVGSLERLNTNGSTRILAGVASDVLSTDIVVRNSSALSDVSTHEIGHALNLLHTHDSFYGIENIERTGNNANCNSAGDKLCDTPADPELNFAIDVDTNCNYIGGETLNGLMYNPDTHNYMSYSRLSCQDEFTSGQVDVMKDALATQAILQPVISSSCSIPTLTGPNLVCNSTTYTLQNGGNNVTWQKSSNLQTVSSSNTSITVAPVNPTTNGDGYVQTIINNTTYRKDLWVRTAVASSFSYVSKQETGLPDPISAGNCDDIAIKLNIRPANFGEVTWEKVSTNFTISEDGTEYAIIAPFSEGSVQFRVKILNFCGWSQWLYYTINVNNCSGGGFGYYQVSPNPASNEVLIKGKTQTSANSQSAKAVDLEQVRPIVKLYDFNGTLIKTIELDPTAITRIDVSNLKEGMYFLKIKVRGEEETHKILVAH